jgi:hypothetical protein
MVVLVTIESVVVCGWIAVWLLSGVGAAWLGGVTGLPVGMLPASIGTTSGGCRRSAGSSPRPSRGGSLSLRASTGRASSTACWSTHPPSTCAATPSWRSHRPWGSPLAVRGPAHRGPAIPALVRLRAGGHARAAGTADFRSHWVRHHRSGRRTWPPGTACVRQRHRIVLIPLPPAVGRAIDQAIGTCTRGPILLNKICEAEHGLAHDTIDREVT